MRLWIEQNQDRNKRIGWCRHQTNQFWSSSQYRRRERSSVCVCASIAGGCSIKPNRFTALSKLFTPREGHCCICIAPVTSFRVYAWRVFIPTTATSWLSQNQKSICILVHPHTYQRCQPFTYSSVLCASFKGEADFRKIATEPSLTIVVQVAFALIPRYNRHRCRCTWAWRFIVLDKDRKKNIKSTTKWIGSSTMSWTWRCHIWSDGQPHRPWSSAVSFRMCRNIDRSNRHRTLMDSRCWCVWHCWLRIHCAYYFGK